MAIFDKNLPLSSDGNTPVNEITVEHIVLALSAIWTDKTETASRLRGKIEHVLS